MNRDERSIREGEAPVQLRSAGGSTQMRDRCVSGDQPSPPAELPGTRFSLQGLSSALLDLGCDARNTSVSVTEQLERLVALGLDRLPQPGSGATLTRWRALAAVAAHDLSLAKLYEGHTDAMAILAEVAGERGHADIDPTSTWGVWASEAPSGRVLIETVLPDGAVLLGGTKSWCSGAAGASHGLLTAWHSDGRGPQLVALALRQPGVAVDAQGWHAVGMAASASLDVHLTRARGRLVGSPGQYLNRPGFWQGGAGVAACWYGGAQAIAAALHRAVAAAPSAGVSPFRMAALGKVDMALRIASAVMREGAAWIDAHPQGDAAEVALRLRLTVEAAAGQVISEVGRTLGATPFCRDERFARMAADLPVFIRQSHAERDFAALGEMLVNAHTMPSGDTLPCDGSRPNTADPVISSPWLL